MKDIDKTTIDICLGLSVASDELQFRFSISGGPGGQHVNKTASKVTLIFDVMQSPSLNEYQRNRIVEKLGHRIDKAGLLQVTAQQSRSQHKNKALTMERFQELLANAMKREKPRRASRPPRGAKEKRLRVKKEKSVQKAQRQWKWSE